MRRIRWLASPILDSAGRGKLLVVLGLLTIGFYLSFWFDDGRLTTWWGVASFTLILLYLIVQVLFPWILYLATHWRRVVRPRLQRELTVDVLITVYDEPPELVERALSAAHEMRGSYRTWLLDDSRDGIYHPLAERYGADYLRREGRRDAKAGNLNAALERTDGEIVVVFDADHAPTPDFLERTLPYFSDSRIGFVQVLLNFTNAPDGWVARAAADSTIDYYRPTSLGADGLHGATLVGSNALIRRRALEEIGGYRPGLAEDLATSVAIQSAGWQSVYVPEPLAPGYSPPDLAAWFTQQLKWSRGVFELLLTRLPSALPRLTWGQRVSYTVRMTYYWLGPLVGAHLLLVLGILAVGTTTQRALLERYLIHALPLAIMFLLIRMLAQRRWTPGRTMPKLPLTALSLVLATWPIYTTTWLMALLRVPLRFRPTPKSRGGRLNLLFVLPQLLVGTLLLAAVVRHLGTPYPVTLAIATGMALPQLGIALAGLYERSRSASGPERRNRRRPKDPAKRSLSR